MISTVNILFNTCKHPCAEYDQLLTFATSLAGCSGLLDVVFAIDASGSIRNERFPLVIDFVVGIAKELEIHNQKTRVGAIKWSDNAEMQFQLNKYSAKQDVVQALRHISFMGGRTHTSSALRTMKDTMFTRSNGDRENVPNVAIIITDGMVNTYQLL